MDAAAQLAFMHSAYLRQLLSLIRVGGSKKSHANTICYRDVDGRKDVV